MPITHIGPFDLQDPLFWLLLAIGVELFLYLDHQPYPLDFYHSVMDVKMHHEDLILWLTLFMLYCLWKMSR